MNTKRLKKVVAREGLVFIGLFGMPFTIASILASNSKYDLAATRIGWLIITYPIYLVIRFILWAIKTLREK